MTLAPGLQAPAENGVAGNGVQTGNRITIYVAGILVGLIQSLQCSDDYGVEPAGSIGFIEPRELVPLSARHQLTLSQMLLSRESLQYVGDQPGNYSIIPESADSSDPTVLTALQGLYMTIQVTDRATGQVLVTYDNCVYSSGDVNFTLNRIVMTNAVFLATHRSGKMVVMAGSEGAGVQQGAGGFQNG